MTKFCFDCGHKLEFKFSPPNFCPQCGTSLKGEISKQPKQAEQKTAQPRRASSDEDGYTDSDYIPAISKLDVDVEMFDSTATQTIGSLFGKQAPARRQRQVRNFDEL